MSEMTATPVSLSSQTESPWVPIGKSPLKSINLWTEDTFQGSWELQITNDPAQAAGSIVVHLSGTEADLPTLDNVTVDALFARVAVTAYTQGTLLGRWGQLT